MRKNNFHVSYTWYKSLLQSEITLGPGQSLSGCCNSVRKSKEEEKMPSVGTFPRDLSAFYLPCKIWRLIFSMLQKIFIRVKLFLCRLQIIFPCCKLLYYAALTGIVFRHLYRNFQKMPIVKNFLNKFVNINNHTHNNCMGC